MIPQGAAEAAKSGDWPRARELLEEIGEPSPEDLDAMAEACWWLDDPRAAIAAWELAYSARLDASQMRAASRTATRIAREYVLALGNDAAANGWLLRAAEALRDEPPCVEQGWIKICESVRAADPSDAEAHATTALDLAREFDDRQLEIYALAQTGIARVQRGEVDSGMDSFDQAMAAATAGQQEDPRVLGDVFCGLVEACMTAADMSRTAQWLDVFNDYLSRYQHPPLLSFCSVCDAESQINEGRWNEAEATLKASMDSMATGVVRARCVHPAALLASIRIDQSRFEEADQLINGLEDLPEIVLPRANLNLARGEPAVAAAGIRRRLNVVGDDSVLAVPLLDVLVQAELARPNLEAAEQATASLEAIAKRSGRAQDQASANLARGRVARVQHDAAARKHLELALGAFGSLAQPLRSGRTRMEIVLLEAEAGDMDLAIDDARIALGVFEEVGAVRDADIASKFLRDHGSSGRAGERGLDTLTRREREVLALLGEGLPNAEIASRLFISTKTAGHHVSSILAKLGMRTRGEAGAYAQRFLAEK